MSYPYQQPGDDQRVASRPVKGMGGAYPPQQVSPQESPGNSPRKSVAFVDSPPRGPVSPSTVSPSSPGSFRPERLPTKYPPQHLSNSPVYQSAVPSRRSPGRSSSRRTVSPRGYGGGYGYDGSGSPPRSYYVEERVHSPAVVRASPVPSGLPSRRMSHSPSVQYRTSPTVSYASRVAEVPPQWTDSGRTLALHEPREAYYYGNGTPPVYVHDKGSENWFPRDRELYGRLVDVCHDANRPEVVREERYYE